MAADIDIVTRVAYDEPVISFGFWPGDPLVREARFYAYAAPEPVGLAAATLAPAAAKWVEAGASHRADLPWEAVRTAPDSRTAALGFLESVYQTAASAADWPVGELASGWTTGVERG